MDPGTVAGSALRAPAPVRALELWVSEISLGLGLRGFRGFRVLGFGGFGGFRGFRGFWGFRV